MESQIEEAEKVGEEGEQEEECIHPSIYRSTEKIHCANPSVFNESSRRQYLLYSAHPCVMQG